MDDLGTILGVWAHPDDEAYLSAGLMARAVRNGSRVVCVTATRGEGGSMDEEAWPPERMGEVRTAELERCLRILGVQEHHWLDLPDIDQTRSGALVALYRYLGEHFKVGVGYNFTDFSDDLTDLSYDHQGVFINMIGTM